MEAATARALIITAIVVTGAGPQAATLSLMARHLDPGIKTAITSQEVTRAAKAVMVMKILPVVHQITPTLLAVRAALTNVLILRRSLPLLLPEAQVVHTGAQTALHPVAVPRVEAADPREVRLIPTPAHRRVRLQVLQTVTEVQHADRDKK